MGAVAARQEETGHLQAERIGIPANGGERNGLARQDFSHSVENTCTG